MPTVLRSGPYRIYTWSHEPDEPPHMHVIHGEKVAKVWLSPVAVEYNYGYNRSELNRVVRLAEANRDRLKFLQEAWECRFPESRHWFLVF